MLRLTPDHPRESIWDAVLPPELLQLPPDLAALDAILADPALLTPFHANWDQSAKRHGRPSIPMATFVRLMVIKHRTGWGYETLVKEVSDSFHLRRFCLIPFEERVPDESTVRKLARRLGPELVNDVIRQVITKAVRERHFTGRAMRCDSTVTEANIRFPTDSGLCGDAVRVLAREARRTKQAVPTAQGHVRDRSRAVGKRLRALGRSLKSRTAKATGAVQQYTEECADQVRQSVREARRLLQDARNRSEAAAGVTSKGQRRERALGRLQETIDMAERVVEQVRKRFAGEKIADRLVSLADPDARVIRRGKRAKPNEFGYIVQLAEVTPNTQKGARGFVLPPQIRPGSTHDNTLFPDTVHELRELGLAPKETVFDAGFTLKATRETLASLGPSIFISGVQEPGSSRSRRRLRRYRAGNEGRIAHLKREFGLARSLLRGTEGARIWDGWAILAYNLDTLARMSS